MVVGWVGVRLKKLSLACSGGGTGFVLGMRRRLAFNWAR